MNNGVEHVKWFLRIFKQRLTDCWLQEWRGRIFESTRYTFYKQFKFDVCLESYLEKGLHSKMRICLTRFRLGISILKTHIYRYKPNVNPNDLLCPLCNDGVDDELHFFYDCIVNENLRRTFLVDILPDDTQRTLIFLSNSDKIVPVAKFIYFSTLLR